MTDELGPTARRWIHQASRDELVAGYIALRAELDLVLLKLRDTVPLIEHQRALAAIQDRDDTIQRYRRIVEHLRKTGAA